MQNGSVDIVNIQFVFDRAHAHLVRRAVSHTAANATTSHPNRVTAYMMIAAIGARTVGRAAHLTSPDYQRIIQQPPAFQIDDQRRHGLVGYPRIFGMPQLQLAMLIPRRVIRMRAWTSDFDEAHTGLDQAPRAQAL